MTKRHGQIGRTVGVGIGNRDANNFGNRSHRNGLREIGNARNACSAQRVGRRHGQGNCGIGTTV